MEFVLIVLAIFVVTGVVAAAVASRAPRKRRRNAELDTPPAPPRAAAAPPAPPRKPPSAPKREKRSIPSGEELDRQAKEVVAEAEALLAAAQPKATPEATPEEEAAEKTLDRALEAVPDAEPEVAEPEAEPEPAEALEPEPEPAAERPRFRDRLGKARAALAGHFGSIRAREKIVDETWDDLEEALYSADVGPKTTQAMLEDLRGRVKKEGISTPDELLNALKEDLKKSLAVADRGLRFEPGQPNVWLFVGVNGVGKTTTIGKVGAQQATVGRSVIMAAGDTFRAAAAEQLELWSKRVGAQLVRGAEGGDPGAVVFDACERAAARNVDLVLADTAGRLHTKVNLMEELRKVRRVADKAPGQVTEVLLVIDATTGQNGLVQARQFTEAVDVTGIVLTKLDGSAKGGIAVAIQSDLGIPIKLVGLGETATDLVDFDPDEFVEALFN